MKSALARQGSVSRLQGPRNISSMEQMAKKRQIKSVTFDKTDEVIQYIAPTPDITEENWELESCESDLDNRPLPVLPTSDLGSTKRVDDFDFQLKHASDVNFSALNKDHLDNHLGDHLDPLRTPDLSQPNKLLPSPLLNTEEDLSDYEPDAEFLTRKHKHAETKPTMNDGESKWREGNQLVRQDSLQESQKALETVQISSNLPKVNVDRTFSQRKQEINKILSPHSAGTLSQKPINSILEEDEEDLNEIKSLPGAKLAILDEIPKAQSSPKLQPEESFDFSLEAPPSPISKLKNDKMVLPWDPSMDTTRDNLAMMAVPAIPLKSPQRGSPERKRQTQNRGVELPIMERAPSPVLAPMTLADAPKAPNAPHAPITPMEKLDNIIENMPSFDSTVSSTPSVAPLNTQAKSPILNTEVAPSRALEDTDMEWTDVSDNEKPDPHIVKLIEDINIDDTLAVSADPNIVLSPISTSPFLGLENSESSVSYEVDAPPPAPQMYDIKEKENTDVHLESPKLDSDLSDESIISKEDSTGSSNKLPPDFDLKRISGMSVATAQTTLDDDISLREPSFGENMTSTMRSLFPEPVNEVDTVERFPYTVRQRDSYVIATSPQRRAMRSSGYEVLTDTNEDVDVPFQTAIPRRPFSPISEPIEPVRAPIEPVRAPIEPVRAPIEPVKAPIEPVKAVKAPDSPILAPVELPKQNYSLVETSTVKSVKSNDTLRMPQPSFALAASNNSVLSKPSIISLDPSNTVQSKPSIISLDNRVLMKDEPSSKPSLSSIHPLTLQPSFADIKESTPNEHSTSTISEQFIPTSKSTNSIRAPMIDPTTIETTHNNYTSPPVKKPLIDEDNFNTSIQRIGQSTSPETQFTKQMDSTPVLDGLLYLKIASIKTKIPDCLATLVIDNGVHCIATKPMSSKQLKNINKEYRIGLIKNQPTHISLKLSSKTDSTVKVKDVEVGADGSFALFDVSGLKKKSFGLKKKSDVSGLSHWARNPTNSVAKMHASSLYIPCVSQREHAPGSLASAEEKITHARNAFKHAKPLMSGYLRQYGGDISKNGRKRFAVIDPVSPLLVIHSSQSQKPRTLINLAKVVDVVKVGDDGMELQFKNKDALAFKASNIEPWIAQLNKLRGSTTGIRPKWIDAVLYEQ